MGFDEYEVRRTSVKVFLAGLILAGEVVKDLIK